MKHPKLLGKGRAPKALFAFVKKQVLYELTSMQTSSDRSSHLLYRARAARVFSFQPSSGLDYHQCYKYLHKLMTEDFRDCLETLKYMSCLLKLIRESVSC